MAWLEEIFNDVFRKENSSLFVTDNPQITFSKGNIFMADQAQTTLIQPSTGKKLLIKGITMETEGNNGVITLKRGNGVPLDPEVNTDVVLPLYASVQNKATVSGEISLLLDIDETLDLEIDGIGSNETFVGVSYREIWTAESFGFQSALLADSSGNLITTSDSDGIEVVF